MIVEKNLIVNPQRRLVPNSPIVTRHGDEIVKDSLRQAGQILTGEAANWLSKLREAERLKSGWRGLIPGNRTKAKAIEAQVLVDISYPGLRAVAETFDGERATLSEHAWQEKLNSL